MQQLIALCLMLLVSSSLISCTGTKSPSPLDVERNTSTTSVDIVERVNLADKMVTLRNLEGQLFTVYVGDQAENLDKVKKGDRVEVTYSEILKVRLADRGEKRQDTSSILVKAAPGETPGAVEVSESNLTATILELDKDTASAKLRLADNSLVRVSVENPENLDRVKVGDTIAIQYMEVISVRVLGRYPARSSTASGLPGAVDGDSGPCSRFSKEHGFPSCRLPHGASSFKPRGASIFRLAVQFFSS